MIGLAALGLAAWAARADGQLLISEFSAANKDAIEDRDGDSSDWIEIFNPSTQTVNLAGWRLTDDPADPAKWVFPATNMAPGAYLVVFASDKDRAILGEELHTNFELSKSGEYLALLDSTGGVAHAFSPAYPAQLTDVSYGLMPGGTTNVLIQTNAACRYVVPVTNNYDGAWLWWGFDDSTWSNGTGSLGFDTNTLYRPLIQTSVSNLMHNQKSSLYVRVPFVVDQPTRVRSLQLGVRIDDGFVLYLNGSEVARTNAGTGIPVWNSTAAAETIGTNLLTFPISRASRRLVAGTNWFCLHAMNRTTGNPDLFVQFSLKAATDTPATGTTACTFFKPPSPGAANDPTRMIRGPMFEWATDRAIGIQTGVTMSVTARVTQTFFPVTTVTSFWRVMYNTEYAVAMRDDGLGGDAVAGDGNYYAVLPATGLGTNQMLRWRYEARDVSNNVTRLPSFYDFADSAEYFGAVAQDPALVSNLPIFWWFCSSTSGAETELGARCSVYFLSNFYDNVSVDLHGQSSSGFPIKSHNFDFNSGDTFLYEAGRRRVTDIDVLSTWADKSKCRVTMAYGSFTAFGHPAHFAFPVRVHRNGAFLAISDMVEDADDRFLERVGLNPDGALYKMYNNLAYNSTPPSWFPGTPGVGTGAEKKNRRDEGNDDLRALVVGLASTQTTANLQRFIFDNVDLPRAVNYFAVMAPTQDHDHHSKNYYLYQDSTGTREWTLLPQDADLTFGHVWWNSNAVGLPSSPAYFDLGIITNSTFVRSGNRMYDVLLATPAFRQMVMRRVRTLTDRTLDPTNSFYIPWIAALTNQMTVDYADYYAKWKTTAWGGQTNWETMVEECNRIINIYLPGRRQYLNAFAEVPASQPAYVPLLIRRLDTSPAGGNQDQEYIELVNTNGFAVDLSGWALSNAVDFTFVQGTVIPAGSNLFVSANSAAFRLRATSPRSNEMAFVTGPFDGHLSSWGETVELWNDAGLLIAATNYPSTPSAWQRDLRITEIMYNPTAPPEGSPYGGGYEFEWIELANLGTNALNLNGVSVTAGITFRFTNDLWLAAGARMALARNRAAFVSRYETNGIFVAGDYIDLLDDGGDTLKLEDPNNETILEFDYRDSWDRRTDGEGWSLMQTNPAASHDAWGDRTNWAANPIWQGTPGRGDPEWPPETVVLNEWLAHSDTGEDWIELRNLSAAPVDIGGWWLSDDLAQLRKFVIPTGTVLAAGGYAVFTETQWTNPAGPGCIVPFALSELGEQIHVTAVSNGAAMTYRHSLPFEASDRDIAFGRHVRSDGVAVYPAMSSPTPGAANRAPRVGPIVLSEILYRPPSNGVEFVEICAPTSGVVQLYDPAAPTNAWKLTGGISYTFPLGSVLTGGQHAVVAGCDPAEFRASNGVPASVQVFGPFEGRLSSDGDRVRLRRPAPPEPTGFVPMVVIDEVDYDDEAPWPAAGNIGGRSIERVDASLYGNDPANWRAGLPNGNAGAALSDGDGDGDGMPDEWEIAQFGRDDPPGHGSDRDGDGRPDRSQYLDGSGISNAVGAIELHLSNSVPPIYWFQSRPAGGFGCQGRVRCHAFEWNTPGSSNDWAAVGGFGRIEADGGTVAITNDASAAFRVYRVRTWMEDRR